MRRFMNPIRKWLRKREIRKEIETITQQVEKLDLEATPYTELNNYMAMSHALLWRKRTLKRELNELD